MKTVKRIPLWHRISGKKYFVIEVEKGLQEDEVLFSAHRIYVSKKNEVTK